jgi:stearoyl-CoA desaturase (delta-9 desaturase)
MKKTFAVKLLVGQTLAVLSIIPMILYANVWQWVGAVVMYSCIMTFGISMGYHRYVSHHAFKCPLWFEYVMLFFAHIMMVGPAMGWVAQHRQHHEYSDTSDDPHSPYYRGILRSYWAQVLSLPKFRYAKDMLRVKRYRYQVKFYWTIIYCWALLLLLTDPYAIIYLWLAPAGFAKLVGSLVFSYSHRNRQPNSDWWLGMLTFGEGFHSEHHANPYAKSYSKYDISGMIIKLIDKD